jgi:hypothetical protein
MNLSDALKRLAAVGEVVGASRKPELRLDGEEWAAGWPDSDGSADDMYRADTPEGAIECAVAGVIAILRQRVDRRRLSYDECRADLDRALRIAEGK